MKNLLLGLVLMVAFASCKKDVSGLPDATQSGANTFGARVNGDYWIPQGNSIISTASILEARITPNGVFINARNFASEPTESEFELYIKDVTGPGVYQLNSETGVFPNQSGSYGYFIKRRFNPINEWITNGQYTGQVTITRFDPANHIVSGIFSFTAKELTNSSDPLTVTDGRFDVTTQ